MKTEHKIHFTNANQMSIKEGVHLVITSPPYPMIKMWDEMFFQEGDCKNHFDKKEFREAYYQMHKQLNRVWDKCFDALCDGGIACVNIGDTCRTLDENFYYFPNHTTITEHFLRLGFQCLPFINWRKPSNKPTKFMGSGMLPPSAYPTLEQEYILIFRKGHKREIKDIERRRKSAYFWEERNVWFCDCWEKILGVKQQIDNEARSRSAAYPLEIPLRLIQMFSIYEDTVLDPFWGMGTTSIAAMLTGRNSIGYELFPEFQKSFDQQLTSLVETSKIYTTERMDRHKEFIKDRETKHFNKTHSFKVITSQEVNMVGFYSVKSLEKSNDDTYLVKYS